MPGTTKLHLEDSLEDSPQTRSLLMVFEKDASLLKKYTTTLHNCCQRILSAQNELCAATQAMAQQLRIYELQKFPLEADDSILTSTLKQFASYLDDISSIHQVLAAQFSETMMFPLSKFLQADIEEISTMFEMFQIATNEHEQAVLKYMKLPKKKENEKVRRDVNEELYMTRKKFHQTALHYYASLNALQYKRKCFLLEPVLAYMHAQRAFFQMGQDAVGKNEIEEFMNNITASVQGVQQEMGQETQKTVELIDTLEGQSHHLYYPEPLIDMPYIPPNINLAQKTGYLYVRSKQSLIATKWERCYFFTQGGNLMSQSKEEFAGSLVIDLNEDGVLAESTDIDDRRFVFMISLRSNKRVVILQAENERERDEWIATINNIVREGGYVKGKAVMQPPQRKSKDHTGSTGSAKVKSDSMTLSASVEDMRQIKVEHNDDDDVIITAVDMLDHESSPNTWQPLDTNEMVNCVPEIMYECEACPFKTKYKCNLKTHVVRCHNRSFFQCQHCPLKFLSKSLLSKHSQSRHKTGIYCEQCGKHFMSAGGLREHVLLLHENKPRYTCTTCQPAKIFSSVHHYEGHMNMHAGIKPYRCSDCGKFFFYRNSLQNHLRKKGLANTVKNNLH